MLAGNEAQTNFDFWNSVPIFDNQKSKCTFEK